MSLPETIPAVNVDFIFWTLVATGVYGLAGAIFVTTQTTLAFILFRLIPFALALASLFGAATIYFGKG